MKAYICCGLIGSGKSTWAQKKALTEGRMVIVNCDAFRSMLKGVYTYDKELEDVIRQASEHTVRLAGVAGYDVVIDETNISRSKRQMWKDLFYIEFAPDVEIICVWCTENKRNLELRMEDPRDVTREKWSEILEGMRNVFEPPDESEGFASIIKVGLDGQDQSENDQKSGGAV